MGVVVGAPVEVPAPQRGLGGAHDHRQGVGHQAPHASPSHPGQGRQDRQGQQDQDGQLAGQVGGVPQAGHVTVVGVEPDDLTVVPQGPYGQGGRALLGQGGVGDQLVVGDDPQRRARGQGCGEVGVGVLGGACGGAQGEAAGGAGDLVAGRVGGGHRAADPRQAGGGQGVGVLAAGLQDGVLGGRGPCDAGLGEPGEALVQVGQDHDVPAGAGQVLPLVGAQGPRRDQCERGPVLGGGQGVGPGAGGAYRDALGAQELGQGHGARGGGVVDRQGDLGDLGAQPQGAQDDGGQQEQGQDHGPGAAQAGAQGVAHRLAGTCRPVRPGPGGGPGGRGGGGGRAHTCPFWVSVGRREATWPASWRIHSSCCLVAWTCP